MEQLTLLEAHNKNHQSPCYVLIDDVFAITMAPCEMRWFLDLPTRKQMLERHSNPEQNVKVNLKKNAQ